MNDDQVSEVFSTKISEENPVFVSRWLFLVIEGQSKCTRSQDDGEFDQRKQERHETTVREL